MSSAAALNIPVIKAKLMNGDYKFIEKRGRSKVWDIFARVSDENGIELKYIVACKSCGNVFKYLTSTSNLVRHKCYVLNKSRNQHGTPTRAVVDSLSRKNITSAMAVWTVENCRSIGIGKDTGLQKLATILIEVGATFGKYVNVDKLMPSPVTISKNIADMYEVYFSEVKNEIANIKATGYSLTSNVWMDNYTKSAYLATIIHYIKKGMMINRLLAISKVNGDSITGMNIYDKTADNLRQFDCEIANDDPIFIIERESDMIEAFKTHKYIYCIDYLLSTVIERAFKEITELNAMLSNACELVIYFKKSGLNSILENALKSCCPTDWFTIYHMLKSVEIGWEEITNILVENNETSWISNLNIKAISTVNNILALFEETLQKLEDDTNPTLHLVIPYIHKLKKRCEVKSGDNEIELQIKTTFLSLIENDVCKYIDKYHKVALFLFPPTNKLLPYDKEERKNIIQACKDLMKQFGADNNDTCNGEEVEEIKEEEENDLFSDFVQTMEVDPIVNKNTKEIEEYQNVEISFRADFDALQWWNQNKKNFPFLYQTSCKILGTPASSTTSKKVLSRARHLITDEEFSSDNHGDMISKIMFLNNYLNKK